MLGYSNTNFDNSKINKKSITRACQFLSHSLVYWQCKKQNSVALSIVKTEYIDEIITLDYDLNYHQIPILYDNVNAINLTKNPIMHYKTKHIQTLHHFIRYHVQMDDISLKFTLIDL